MGEPQRAPHPIRRLAGPIHFSQFVLASAASVPFNLFTRAVLSQVMPFEAALAPAHVVGMLVAFFLTRAFVFRDSGATIPAGLGRFALVNAGSLLITTLAASFCLRILFPLANFTLFPATAAHIAGLAVASVFSYFGHRYYSFRSVSATSDKTRVSSYALFLLACAGFVVLARLYTLVTPEQFNVDEAQWTVSARRILTDWVVWRSTDLTTSGPLNAAVISWPNLFGMTPSILSSRLTGVLLLALSVLMLASLVRRGEGFGLGASAVALLAAVLGLSSQPDLIHYSSELFSVALIAAFGRLYVDLPRKAVWRWLVCGLVATSLPLAKLQSALFCLLFHASCVVMLIWNMRRREPWLRQALAYAVGAILPALVLIAPAVVVGEQKAFFDGYLGLGDSLGEHTLTVFVTFAPFLVGMAFLWLAVLLMRLRGRSSIERWDILVLSIAIWPVAILTVWLPGRSYVHYAFYLLVALPLSVVLLERSLRTPSDRRIVASRRLAIAGAVLGVTAFGAVSLPSLTAAYAVAKQDASFRLLPADGVVSRPLFAWTGVAPSDRILMWGWEPRLTAFSQLSSADRAAHAEFLIRPNRERAYYRDRMLRDITQTPPSIIIDANRPGNFFGNFPGYRPENFHLNEFPALSAVVDADYVRIAGNELQTAVYLRNSLAAGLRGAEIPLASPNTQLIDNSLTERSNDWVDFDATSTLAFSLRTPEPIHEIWILTSRGGPDRQRGSTRVAIDLETTAGVRRMNVSLFNYPDWTVIPVDLSAPTVSFNVMSLESVGAGPALNEIKAFRAQRLARG